MAFGLEYREEILSDRPDSNSYVGSGGGDPFRGTRQVGAGYVGVRSPLWARWVEFSVAGRFEDYSDFGSTFKPKFGVKVTPARLAPPARLLLRVLQGSGTWPPFLRFPSLLQHAVQRPEFPG